MLTLKQIQELKRLTHKYGYDLALSKKLDKDNKPEMLASLLTKELHDNVRDDVEYFIDRYPVLPGEDPSIAKERILMAIFGSISGQLMSVYDTNKEEAVKLLNEVFDTYQKKHLGDENE